MACMMCIVAGLMVSLFVPNGSISKLYTFLRRILLVKGTAAKLEPAATKRAGPSGRDFGVTLGSGLGQFGVSLGIGG